MDYYQTLGVSREASLEEVKKAYRKLARTNHPDKFPEAERDAATQRFQEISRAYEVLSDPDKKKIYDLGGEEALKSGGAGAQVNPFDIFNSFFGGGMNGMGGMGGMSGEVPQGFPPEFAQAFGKSGFPSNFSQGFPFGPRGQSGRSRQINKNKPTVYPIHVSLKEVFTGRRKKLKVTKRVIYHQESDLNIVDDWSHTWDQCDGCKGMGSVIERQQLGPNMFAQNQRQCPNCQGTGYQLLPGYGIREISEIVEIEIIKGVTNGTEIRIPDQGNVIPGTYPGDLIVVLQTQETSGNFTRQGNDLLYHQTVTLPEALTGGTFQLTDLLDEEKTVSYSRVLPGEEKRIVGQGIAGSDLIIKFSVNFPEKIRKHQREEIRKIFGYSPKSKEKPDYQL